MVTAASVEVKVRMNRIVPNGAANLCPFLPFILFKIISAMIMTPPAAKPNPGTEYTEIEKLILFTFKFYILHFIHCSELTILIC